MTVPFTSELWPSPASMKEYLDTWARFVYELETQVRTQEAIHRRTEEALTADVVRLTHEVEECAAPRDQRIAELEVVIKGLERQVQELAAERHRAMERLAQVLEIKITNATTMQDLIGQTMTLVDHSKAVFRERL